MIQEKLIAKRAKLSPNKRGLLERWKRGNGQVTARIEHTAMTKQDSGDNEWPVSLIQEARLLHREQLRRHNVFIRAENIGFAFRITGRLNLIALERGFNEVLRRHHVLRASFKMVYGRHVQTLAPARYSRLPLLDLRSLPLHQREGEALKLAMQVVERPFDVTRGPLVRMTVIELSDEEHVGVAAFEHLAFDGHSMGVFNTEMASLYRDFSEERTSSLPELITQYTEYASWQRKRLQDQVISDRLTYWEKHFDGQNVFPELTLNIARPVSRIRSSNGARQALSLPPALFEALQQMSRKRGVTMFVSLLSTLKLLLRHYTSQDRIGVISPFLNREHPHSEKMIGWFANCLNLSTDLSGDPSFHELLERVRQVTLDAFQHQDLPLYHLLKILQPAEHERIALMPSGTFGANYVYFEMIDAKSGTIQLPGLKLTPVRIPHDPAVTSLSISAIEHREGLSIDILYEDEKYDEQAMQLFLANFKSLLGSVVNDPQRRITDLFTDIST